MTIVMGPYNQEWRITKQIEWRISDVPAKAFQVDIVDGQIGSKIIGGILLLFWVALIVLMPPKLTVEALIPFWVNVLLWPIGFVLREYIPRILWILFSAVSLLSMLLILLPFIKLLVWGAPFFVLINWVLNRYRRITAETVDRGIRAETWTGYVRGMRAARKEMKKVKKTLENYGVPEETPAKFARIG